jgi:molybdopterin molybdotransferase
MQEQAQAAGEQRIRIGSGHRRGQHVRHAGEDIRRGEELLGAGRRIGPAELGLMASLGMAEVRVYRRVRAAYFASGNELRSIGDSLGEGEIYDSNRYTLYGMLTEIGVEMIDIGVVPDRPEELAAALDNAADNADLVLTTGGVSVGEADHIKRLIGDQGEILFSRVKIKPGRPVTFGRWGGSWFFGLPGNPVAAMVAFYQFARPALRRLQGESDTTARRLTARTEGILRKRRGRTEVQRGILLPDDTGELWVRSSGAQGSAVLSSMSRGNCFIILEEQRNEVAAGETVSVEPFEMVRF